jgi:hypothetical protein
MTAYQPPLDDVGFCLVEFVDLAGLGELRPDLVSAVLAEAGPAGSRPASSRL